MASFLVMASSLPHDVCGCGEPRQANMNVNLLKAELLIWLENIANWHLLVCQSGGLSSCFLQFPMDQRAGVPVSLGLKGPKLTPRLAETTRVPGMCREGSVHSMPSAARWEQDTEGPAPVRKLPSERLILCSAADE